MNRSWLSGKAGWEGNKVGEEEEAEQTEEDSG